MNRVSVQQPQPMVIGAAFVKMIDVNQHAGLGMAGLDGDAGTFSKPVEIFRKTPELQLRHNADLVAGLEQCAVTLPGLLQVQARRVGRAGWRGGQSFAADLRDQVHLEFGPLQSVGAPGIVIDDPLRKSDRALDRKAEVRDSPLQIRQRSALFFVLLDGIGPRLDRLITCFGRNLDLFDDPEFLSSNGGCVQAKQETAAVRGRGVPGFRRRGHGRAAERRADPQPGAGHGLAPRQFFCLSSHGQLLS